MVIVKMGDGSGSKVVIGEDSDEVLTDRTVIFQKVTEAVKAGAKAAKPKDTLLIKAEKEVPLKDIAHIASAAGELMLRLAVVEKDK